MVHESVVAAGGASGDVCCEFEAFVGACAAGLSSCDRHLVLGDSVSADLLCRRHHYHPEHLHSAHTTERETSVLRLRRKEWVFGYTDATHTDDAAPLDDQDVGEDGDTGNAFVGTR